MKNLAIVGLGPRGLYALEQVISLLAENKKIINIMVFEPTSIPGAGPVWNTTQVDSNWANITERALVGLTQRPTIIYNNIIIEAFPSYHEWCDFSINKIQLDIFPPRRKVGHYLSERFNSLAKANVFEIVKSRIDQIDFSENKIILTSNMNKRYSVDDVLFTVGHQKTKLSKQLKSWKAHTDSFQNLKLYTHTYPVSQFKLNDNDIKIGIMGFGLAMVDVMRACTLGRYGHFKIINPKTLESEYIKTKKHQPKLIPFSLDGLPLAPKPISKTIDNWYKPTKTDLFYVKNAIEMFNNKEVHDIQFITKLISKIVASIYTNLNQKALHHSYENDAIEAIVLNYLNDETFKHDLIFNRETSVYKTIQSFVNMALGNEPITLDYCIWQVWRQCQPTLYIAFSHANVNHKIIKQVIDLDDRSKRYSYGPPVESIQQMLALVEANVLDLDFVNNPKITPTKNGWKFENSYQKQCETNIMINSVLDTPQLKKVNSKIIKSLLNHNIIQPIHSDLGIDTNTDGTVIMPNDESNKSISVLGRLSKGSVIGVDAILECFGKRIEDWAKAFVKRV